MEREETGTGDGAGADVGAGGEVWGVGSPLSSEPLSRSISGCQSVLPSTMVTLPSEPCCRIRDGDTIGAVVQSPGVWQKHREPRTDPRNVRPWAGP